MHSRGPAGVTRPRPPDDERTGTMSKTDYEEGVNPYFAIGALTIGED